MSQVRNLSRPPTKTADLDHSPKAAVPSAVPSFPALRQAQKATNALHLRSGGFASRGGHAVSRGGHGAASGGVTNFATCRSVCAMTETEMMNRWRASLLNMSVTGASGVYWVGRDCPGDVTAAWMRSFLITRGSSLGAFLFCAARSLASRLFASRCEFSFEWGERATKMVRRSTCR